MNMLQLVHDLTVVLVGGISAIAALACSYLLALTLGSRRPRAPRIAAPALRFAVVVPAHDEACGIADTVTSLRALDWPQDRFSVTVVADNCSDDTAARALSVGALVLERHDTSLRGKGYALAYAFDRLMQEGWADAMVVIDADTRADANLLSALAVRISAGEQVLQAHYGVLNPSASWRTRLMTIALSAFHTVRSRGRERLGLSCGIRGNGWCVSRPILAEVPYRAYSLVEDIEYGARLTLAGHRVAYVEEAGVRAAMVSRAEHAAPQRRRWELGRRQLLRTLVPALLRSGSAACIELAIDLLVPPLSQLAVTVLACIAAAVALNLHWVLAVDVASALALVAYVARGWQLSGLGWVCAFDFLRVPYFVAWKLAVLLRRGSGIWTRTQREQS